MPNAKSLEAANHALKAGDKARAKQLLLPLLKADPRNEDAWLHMAMALDDEAQKRECIDRALRINPASMLGRKMLTALDKAAMTAGLNAPLEAPPVSTTQPESDSLRAALMPEYSNKPVEVFNAMPETQDEGLKARAGDAISDGTFAGMIGALLILIVPIIAIFTGYTNDGDFYFVMGIFADLAIPLIGGMVAGYLYNRRRPNINKNHFAIAGGVAGLVSGAIVGLLHGMAISFMNVSDVTVSLSSAAGITNYLLMCGLGPAVLGFGLGAVGAMLFGAFVPKSATVHVADDPDSKWNRYKRASVRRSKRRAMGVVIALVIYLAIRFCSSI